MKRFGCGGGVLTLLAGMAMCGLTMAVAVVALLAINPFSADNIYAALRNALGGTWSIGALGGYAIPSVERLTPLSNLSVVRFNYAAELTAASDMPDWLRALYGNSLVLIAVGHIEAGIDFSAMTQDDITYDAETRTLSLSLPPPQLQTCYLNPAQTQLMEVNRGVFAGSRPQMDNDLRLFAISEFRQRALAEDILAEAATGATELVREFVQLLQPANADVTLNITTKPYDLNALNLPETCTTP